MTYLSPAQNRGVPWGPSSLPSAPGTATRPLGMLPMSRRIGQTLALRFSRGWRWGLLQMRSMGRRISNRAHAALLFITAYLLLAVGVVLGLAYFVAELFRRPGIAARAPVPAPAEGGA